MFFNIVCYCGQPVCDLYRHFMLAKLLTFQDQTPAIEEAVKRIKTEFSPDQYDTVFDFLFVSFDHLNIFQLLDKKKALKDLLRQYAEIYPYDDMAIPDSTQDKIMNSAGI
jgi:hypothetical protein